MRKTTGALGGEAGSLLATADEATMSVILEGMKEADDDLRLMEAWKRSGFVTGFSTLSVLYGSNRLGGSDDDRPVSDVSRRLREGYELLGEE